MTQLIDNQGENKRETIIDKKEKIFTDAFEEAGITTEIDLMQYAHPQILKLYSEFLEGKVLESARHKGIVVNSIDDLREKVNSDEYTVMVDEIKKIHGTKIKLMHTSKEMGEGQAPLNYFFVRPYNSGWSVTEFQLAMTAMNGYAAANGLDLKDSACIFVEPGIPKEMWKFVKGSPNKEWTRSTIVVSSFQLIGGPIKIIKLNFKQLDELPWIPLTTRYDVSDVSKTLREAMDMFATIKAEDHRKAHSGKANQDGAKPTNLDSEA